MFKLRGWGSLLAVALPLFIWLAWSQLGAESSRVTLQRYSDWAASGTPPFALTLSQFYLKNNRPAGPSDVTLPDVPPKSGIKSWIIQADTTLLITLDAKIDGRAVQLRLVPVVRTAKIIYYDCLSETSQVYLHGLCQAEFVKSLADIPAQLAENTQTISEFPDVITASGASLAPNASRGSVVVVPATVADLDHCGYQCVKPQSCNTPRPLACSKIMTEGNTRWFEVTSSSTQVRAEDISTRTGADQACEQALGAGFQVLKASSITGTIKLGASAEYWVHDDLRAENNCWKSDYR